MRDKAKEKKYLIARVKKKQSIRKAAKTAGVSLATAVRTEADPRYKSAMALALERAGCTEDHIAKTVMESTEATKVISANIIRKGATADERDGMKDADEHTKDFVEVPDYQARIKAAELAGKFRGDFVERSEMELKGSVTIRIRSNVKG